MSRKLAAPILLAAALALPAAAGAAEGGAPMSVAPEASEADATCNVQPDLGADRAGMLTRLQDKLASEQAVAGGDVVVLNGRGYRYDARPSIARDLHVLEIELERAKAAAKAEKPAKP